MINLNGDKIFLRAVEPEDATALMLWENNPEYWHVSDTEIPFSLFQIKHYIENAQNFRSTGQLRFIICSTLNKKPIGTIDLFDANFKHRRAGIGILIADKNERGKGYAKQAVELLIEYAKRILDMHQLYCSVEIDNRESLALFNSLGFRKTGIFEGWNTKMNQRIDVVFYQLIL
jgi:diamine N-acetyltransferase